MALLPSVPEEGRLPDCRHAALRRLGRQLAALAEACGPCESLSFSYTRQAAFCCRGVDVSAALDCEPVAGGAPALAMREFLARAVHAGARGWSDSQTARAWTVIEAVAKLAGTGLTAEILANDWKAILRRKGATRLNSMKTGWRSLAFCGHWLTVAFGACAEPVISVTRPDLRALLKPCFTSI